MAKIRKVKKAIGLTDTLKSLQIGTPIEVKERDYRMAVVRNTITRLKKKGLEYDCTCAGLIDSCIVTRVK